MHVVSDESKKPPLVIEFSYSDVKSLVEEIRTLSLTFNDFPLIDEFDDLLREHLGDDIVW